MNNLVDDPNHNEITVSHKLYSNHQPPIKWLNVKYNFIDSYMLINASIYPI